MRKSTDLSSYPIGSMNMLLILYAVFHDKLAGIIYERLAKSVSCFDASISVGPK